jgi:hypothetical protein
MNAMHAKRGSKSGANCIVQLPTRVGRPHGPIVQISLGRISWMCFVEEKCV